MGETVILPNLLTTKELCAYLKLSRNSAVKFGKLHGAEYKVGGVSRWNAEIIKKSTDRRSFMKERFITSTVLQNGEDMHTWTVKDQDFLISGGLKRRKVEQKEDVFHESVYLSIGMPRTLFSLRINGREWEAHNEKIEVYLDQTSIKSVIECMNELLECLKDNMEEMR